MTHTFNLSTGKVWIDVFLELPDQLACTGQETPGPTERSCLKKIKMTAPDELNPKFKFCMHVCVHAHIHTHKCTPMNTYTPTQTHTHKGGIQSEANLSY